MQQLQSSKNIKAFADCNHITADYMRNSTDKKKAVLVDMTAKFLTRCLHAIENYGKRGDRCVLWQVPLDEWLCLDQYGYDDVKKVVYSVLENVRGRGFNVFTIGPGFPLYFVIDWGLTKQKPVETVYDFMRDVKDAREALSQRLANKEQPAHFNNMEDFMKFYNYYFNESPNQVRLGPTTSQTANKLGLVPDSLTHYPTVSATPANSPNPKRRKPPARKRPKAKSPAPPRPAGVAQAFVPPLPPKAHPKSGLLMMDL